MTGYPEADGKLNPGSVLVSEPLTEFLNHNGRDDSARPQRLGIEPPRLSGATNF